MTLKEKFSLILMQFWASDWEGQCEQAADEFAIDFADWVRVCKMKGRGYDFDDVKQLLEIYKDEKGL